MATEQATPLSSVLYGGGGERGGGGKFRKPPARKPPPTPYDRPQSNRSQVSDGGWLSKLVDPAYRLIAGGATRILPSIFSKSSFSAASSSEDQDSGGSEVEETACGGNEGCTLDLEISEPGGINSNERAEIWKGSSDCDQLGQDKTSNIPDGPDFSKIEQLVKGRRFSRDELSHLTEILNSRVVDPSNVDSEGKKQSMDIKREGKEAVLARENSRMSTGEKQEVLDGARVETSTPLLPLAAKEAVGASPVDIARAYMRTRVSEVGTASRRIISEEERSLQQSDGFASPLMPSRSPKSSVCWPGAMVQDQHDYSTPQSSRYGLHHFQRTPYSRTMYSKSKPELTRSPADKKRYPNTLSTPRLQPQTTIFGKDYALNDANVSVGPIRRAQRKFVSEARPRGSGSFRFPQSDPLQLGNSSLSNGFLPAVKKNLEVGPTSTHSEFQSVDNMRKTSDVGIPALQSSNPAVRAILEHLERNKPTPKEKSAELQLATEWKKSSSSKETDAMLKEGTRLPRLEGFDIRNVGSFVEKGFFAQENARENSNFKVKPAERSTSQSADGNKDIGTSSILNGSNGPQMKCSSENTSFKFKNSVEQKGKNQLWPIHNQNERQGNSSSVPNFAGSELPKKPPVHSSGSKPNLASLSVGKPNFGFTFPVSTSSGVLPEPPTPSIMPSTLASSPPQPKDVPAIPSYSFGTKRSTPPLVFSFTSNSSVQDNDVADIKFSFGSDGKNRVSFRSIS